MYACLCVDVCGWMCVGLWVLVFVRGLSLSVCVCFLNSFMSTFFYLQEQQQAVPLPPSQQPLPQSIADEMQKLEREVDNDGSGSSSSSNSSFSGDKFSSTGFGEDREGQSVLGTMDNTSDENWSQEFSDFNSNEEVPSIFF